MITLIAAIGKNNSLGLDNKLLWHLPNDFKSDMIYFYLYCQLELSH